MSMGSARLKCLLAFIFILSGCAALKPQREPASVTPSSITAQAVVEMNSGLSGRATVYVMSPASFRIEVKYPFGQLAALLVSDGAQLYSFSGNEEKRFEWGDPKAPLLLEADEAASLLMGLKATSLSGERVERDDQGRILRVQKDGFTVTLSDYRVEAGADIPHMIVIRKGAEAIRIKYNSVEVNTAFPDGVFEVPGAPASN